MDLLELISQSDLYTLHSHTEYCDGHAPMSEFAEQAAAQGFAVYGFSPHSPIPFESPCNMSPDDVEPYLQQVKQLSQQYPQVRFLAGMEIDYLGPHWGPASECFRRLPLDFTIGSVHFIPNQEGEYVDIDGRYESFKGKMHDKFHDDIHYVVTKFFEQSTSMLQEGHFDILGHFDKIKHNGGLYLPGLEDTPWYTAMVNDLIDLIIESKVIVEINTKAWAQHQQLFPAQRHWKRLLSAGVPLIVNSDAHYPALINASRPAVLASLRYLTARQ